MELAHTNLEEANTVDSATPAEPCLCRKIPDLKDSVSSLVVWFTHPTTGAFKSAFTSLADDSARIRLCTEQDVITRHLNQHVALGGVCNCSTKDPAQAANLNEFTDSILKGDGDLRQASTKSDYLKLVQMNTFALSLAPPGSQEASLLYGARSASWFTLKQYENALDDIERAFACEQPVDSPEVLLLRQAECLLHLGRSTEAAQLLVSQQAGALQDPDTAQGARWAQLGKLASLPNRKVAKRDVQMSSFHSSEAVIKALVDKGKFNAHPRFPWLNAKVDLIYDQEKGRFQLVSLTKLSYGEIVAIGKPFAGFASLTVHFKAGQCHHCFLDIPGTLDDDEEDEAEGLDAQRKQERLLAIQQLTSGPLRRPAPVPCPKCSKVLYCSEACRFEAWCEYHAFECAHFALLSSLDPTCRLALRMLYSAGSLEMIKQAVKDWETVEDKVSLVKSPRDYSFVYAMRQPEVRSVKEDFRQTVTAVCLAKLAQLSGFVPNTPEDVHFAACILLRHLRQIKANLDSSTSEESSAFTLHGLASTMEYSCEPTVGLKGLFQDATMLSNVQLFYVARGLPRGVALTQAYSTDQSVDPLVAQFDRPHSLVMSYNTCPCQEATEEACLRQITQTGSEDRSGALFRTFGVTCKCTRCRREEADSQGRVYLPLACPACRSLMIRTSPDEDPISGYVCSSPSGCSVKMSLPEVKSIYKKVLKLTSTTIPALCAANRKRAASEAAGIKFTNALRLELNKVTPYLYGGSPFLASLYIRISVLLNHRCGSRQDSLNHTLLTHASMYADKALEVIETLSDGADVDNGLTVNCLRLAANSVGKVVAQFSGELAAKCVGPREPYCIIVQRHLGQVRSEAAAETTDYDWMVAGREVPTEAAEQLRHIRYLNAVGSMMM